MRHVVLAALVLLCATAARAAEPAVAEPPPPAPATTATPPTTSADAAESARIAAEAAKSAAESARASADALKQVVEALKAAKAPEPTPPAPAIAPAEPAKAGPPPWAFQLGASVLSVTGNANAVTGKLAGQAEGRWDAWATKIVGGVTYGQSTAPAATESVVTALNANLSARGERGISDTFKIYALGGGMMDQVASISLQSFAEAGAGIVWWESVEEDFVKSRLSTDLGFRFTRELRATYFPEFADLPDIDIYSPRIAGSFRYAISRTAVFTEEFEILPDLVDSANLRSTSTSTLSAQIDQGVALSIGFKIRYIGAPAANAQTTDSELSAGVAWAF